MPPHRLFTFIGALINMRVLQVRYAIKTPVMLKNEVGMTLAELDSDVRTCESLIDLTWYPSWVVPKSGNRGEMMEGLTNRAR
jgi:hypothetical protein